MPTEPAPAALTAVAERLAVRFGGTVPADTIHRVLHDEYQGLLATSTITTYLPLLAERAADARLSQIAGRHRHTSTPAGAG
jgi:hypothetical protein